jgi:hypothetical protein
MALPVAAIVAALTTVSAQNPTLVPLAYKPLTIKNIKPTGWLMNELQVQGQGLSGALLTTTFWEPSEVNAQNDSTVLMPRVPCSVQLAVDGRQLQLRGLD